MLDETANSSVPALPSNFDPSTASAAELVEFNATTKVPSPDPDRAKLLNSLSDGREFHPAVIAAETRQHMGSAATSMWEAARRLAWAREEMETSAWTLWVENEVGVSRRTAYAWMSVARSFAPIGGPTEKMLGHGKTAMVELITHLSTEEIEELEDGGEVEGLGAHDDIARMSVRQLQKKLRDREKDLQAEQELRESSQRKLKAAHSQLDQIRLAADGDDESKRAEFESVEGDLLLGLSKTRAWVLRQDWPSASPYVRSKGAAVLAQLNQYIRDLRNDLLTLGVDDLLPPGFDAIQDTSTLMHDIGAVLDAYVGADDGADEFSLDEVCGGGFRMTLWEEDVARAAIARLVEQRFAEPVGPQRWRWLGVPDQELPAHVKVQHAAANNVHSIQG